MDENTRNSMHAGVYIAVVTVNQHAACYYVSNIHAECQMWCFQPLLSSVKIDGNFFYIGDL